MSEMTSDVECLRRLKELMLETGGRFVFGGLTNISQKFIQPTVYADVVEFDVLMQHEVSHCFWKIKLV